MVFHIKRTISENLVVEILYIISIAFKDECK